MKILVGYDRSDESRDALKLAQMHAKAMDAKIVVATSITREEPLQYHEIKKAEHELEREVQEAFNGDCTPCETHLLVSDLSPGDQLIRFAERHKIDEIIVGARKRSKVGKLFLGSTAQYMVLHAPCPVVTVN